MWEEAETVNASLTDHGCSHTNVDGVDESRKFLALVLSGASVRVAKATSRDMRS